MSDTPTPEAHNADDNNADENSAYDNSADSPSISEQLEAELDGAIRDMSDIPAVELIQTVAVHLLSASAVKCGLSENPEGEIDLAEARKLITALAGLITAAAPEIGDHHARVLRDGLRSVQLAFREASAFPDPPGKGPGEKYTGPVN